MKREHRKQGFQKWFAINGDDLLTGWIRAREDGNDESFSDWVMGEYDYYLEVPHHGIEDEYYEIPYHGLCDSPSKIESMLFPKVEVCQN